MDFVHNWKRMNRNTTTSGHRSKIECLEKQSILVLPDEVIEEIMTFLLFSDLFNLSKVKKRLKNCAKRVMENKPFSKYIIKSKFYISKILLYFQFIWDKKILFCTFLFNDVFQKLPSSVDAIIHLITWMMLKWYH